MFIFAVSRQNDLKSIRNLDFALDAMIFISGFQFSAAAKSILMAAESKNINQQEF